ncbi:hypothetical protein Dcar01_01103 [Deinococcus carri]|uniref:Uncharacterized protein n=1 Tax=Deinococcus carri TaxID=1211323 RepID=A0ABP9W4W6_9DEIO
MLWAFGTISAGTCGTAWRGGHAFRKQTGTRLHEALHEFAAGAVPAKSCATGEGACRTRTDELGLLDGTEPPAG